jgi:hypothetical protein
LVPPRSRVAKLPRLPQSLAQESLYVLALLLDDARRFVDLAAPSRPLCPKAPRIASQDAFEP